MDRIILDAVKVTGALFMAGGLLAGAASLAWWAYREIVGFKQIVKAVLFYRANKDKPYGD